jgi:type 2 lantibiotic biosynthesis protein LanM
VTCSAERLLSGSQVLRTRLPPILAKASSPEERRQRLWVAPTQTAQSEGSVADREAAWIHAAAGGNKAKFESLLERRGLTCHDARSGLLDVKVLSQAPLPSWAIGVVNLALAFSRDGEPIPTFSVRDLLGGTTPHPQVDPDAAWLFHQAFEPFLRQPAEDLRCWSQGSTVLISDSAQRQMLVQLAKRWNSVAARVFLSEVTVPDALVAPPREIGPTVFHSYLGGGIPCLERWLDLWSAFPVLARLMAVVSEDWSTATRELLYRLSQDRELIEQTVLMAPLGRLEAYAGDAGDVHDGGRSVAVLRLSAGYVVYKPRDARAGSAYAEIISRFNAESSLSVRVPDQIARDGYSWHEFVDRSACTTTQELHDYYCRLGVHARLLEAVQANDMHYENVIGCAGQPVPVDLETIFSPCVPERPGAILDQGVAAAVRDSPTYTGLITCKAKGARGRAAVEFGAMCPHGEFESPFKSALFDVDQTGAARFVLGYGTMQTRPALSSGEAPPLEVSAVVEAVLEGYRQAEAFLSRNTLELLAFGGPLRGAADAEVRYVHRESHIYERLITLSLAPACLRDGVNRELLLERLWIAPVCDDAAVRITEAELAAVRGLDIPLFRSRPGSRDVILPDLEEVRDYFRRAALDEVSERLERRRTNTSMELDGIMAALFIRDPGSPIPKSGTAEKSASHPQSVSFLSQATGIGDWLLSNCRVSRDGTPTWFGLEYEPEYDVWKLGPLSSGLFTGTAGLAVVFADLFRATGTDRYREAAAALVGSANSRLDEEISAAEDDISTLAGWGGTVYSSARAAGTIGLSARAGTALTTLDPAARTALTLSMLGSPAVAHPGSTPEDLSRLVAERRRGHHWLATFEVVASGLPLRGVPPATEGAQLALARLGNGIPLDTGSSPSAPSRQHAGALIARLALAQCGYGNEELLRDVDAYLADVRPSSDALDRGEVAMSAYEVTGDLRYLEFARLHGQQLYEQYFASGSWFPELLAPDVFYLSAFVGVAAVAHLFLRLESPGLLPSLRVLG